MKIAAVTDDLFILRGMVNVYLINTKDGWALIDTGFRNSADKILKAIASVGKKPSDIRHIIITHGHPDHMGSAAALKKATGADVYAHEGDASIIEAGTGYRAATPIPGWKTKLLFELLLKPSLKRPIDPTKIDHYLVDGVGPPFAPDLIPIETPGHSAGQVSLLWRRHGGVLFTADACINMRGLDLAAAQEDIEETLRSLHKLCRLDFEIACFGHGPPIMSSADQAFRAKWGRDVFA